MNKKIDKTCLITTLICLWPIILGTILYSELPNEIAIHFDASGNPDNYFSKSLAVFGLPSILAAINLFVHFRVNTDPKKKNASNVLKSVYKWTLPAISTILMPITLFKAMGAELSIGELSYCITGLLILVCGNYLPKCKSNYTIGFKLPWTLNDEDNWNKTHRFAGFVWVIGGIITIANVLISSPYILFGIIILLIILPIVYSYILYRQKTQQEQINK